LSSLPATTLVFYDGLCGLCDEFVQFLLKRDRYERIAFAALQGEHARRTLLPRGHDPTDLDSVFVVADWKAPRERVLNRSNAVLYAVAQLGGVWRVLAVIGGLAPTALADTIYGFVARHRYRIFGRYDTCPLPRPEWKNRFLD
jgi:predicted DCC family thiol-disulfide oxidoreductase YuxK